MVRRNPSRTSGWKLLVLAAALTGCTSATEIDRIALEHVREAEQLWQQAGPPATYTMVVRRVTVADPLARPVRVHVNGTQITSAVYTDNDAAVPAGVREQLRTVPGYFQMIRDLIGQPLADLTFDFHPQYGYATEIRVDYDRSRFDDDVQILITDMAF
jgi:hypothetical protein